MKITDPAVPRIEANLAAMLGRNVSPDRHHYLANRLAAARMARELAEMEAAA